MRGRPLIPAGLADIAPGPELARVLDGLEPSELSGFECVAALKAQYRQLNHTKARLLTMMAETGLRDGADAGRMAAPDEFSADEIRAALVLTRRAADAQLDLAYDLLTRLPAVHAAMDAGVLDEPRARVFADWTLDLADQQARLLCAELLPRASRLTTGQLVEQIKRHAIALDPEWAQRRYESAIANRKVVGYRNPDGSANLSGVNLPVDRVAAASGRIDALAKSVKHAGDHRPIDHIRADLFLGMTDGSYAGLDDATIVEQLRTTGPTGHEAEPDNPAPDGAAGTEADGGNTAAAGGARPGPGMELRARLSTLLGRDQHPAELAGWGPVHAELARDLAAGLGGAQWRYAITDEHGQLRHAGITAARPVGTGTREVRSRAIVELQVPETELRALATTALSLGPFAPVVADLTGRLDTHPAGDGDTGRRAPGAALLRWLQLRDRTCVMVGCRNPARGTDQDHTRAHARGGPTVDTNLGAACRHDHRLKDEGGWHLHQPQPGVFLWSSRLGHRYRRPLPPIIEPLPDPFPRGQPRADLDAPSTPVGHGRHAMDSWHDKGSWHGPPPEAVPEPPVPPLDPGPDIPPF